MKQITLPAVGMRVEALGPDMKALIFDEVVQINVGGNIVDVPGDSYAVPMPNDIARQIGNQLIGSSLVKASVTDLNALKGA